MKILIKANKGTYNQFQDANFTPYHVCSVWNHQLRDTFRELGHEVNFIGNEELANEIITDYVGYDVLFFHQLPSFIGDVEFSISLLKNFRGKKVLYIPTYISDDYKELIELFDYILVAGSLYNVLRWRVLYLDKVILPVSWHSPRFECIDVDLANPYKDDSFKVVYFGIITERYLDILKRLAADGEQVYIGGIYAKKGEDYTRFFIEEEVKEFPENLKLITPNGVFVFGAQFHWIRYADLGLAFTDNKVIGCLRHKIVEYLCCGIKVLAEETIAIAYRVLELHAGFVFPYDNYDILYKLVQYEKQNRYDKEKLKAKARGIFDMHAVCNQILEAVAI